MMDLLRDLRQGFRLLQRAPGFAAMAIITLALGIGATTALFTVVNAVLLDPLPFPDSGKLIQVWRSELPALTYGSASDARYLDLAAVAARVHRPWRMVAAWADDWRARRARTRAGCDGHRVVLPRHRCAAGDRQVLFRRRRSERRRSCHRD